MLCHYDQKQVESTPHTTDVIVLAVLGSELRQEKRKGIHVRKEAIKLLIS